MEMKFKTIPCFLRLHPVKSIAKQKKHAENFPEFIENVFVKKNLIL